MEMNGKTISIIIVIVVVLVSGLGLVLSYNKMVSLEADIDGNWQEIYNQEERKMDLIPQLVNQSSQYQEFESSTLTQITELRSRWQNTTDDRERANISDESQSLIGDIIVTYEAYPYLQAVGPLQNVMDEIAGTENRIAYARTLYIESVVDYNKAIKKFPKVLYASSFGFEEQESLYGSAP